MGQYIATTICSTVFRLQNSSKVFAQQVNGLRCQMSTTHILSLIDADRNAALAPDLCGIRSHTKVAFFLRLFSPETRLNGEVQIKESQTSSSFTSHTNTLHGAHFLCIILFLLFLSLSKINYPMFTLKILEEQHDTIESMSVLDFFIFIVIDYVSCSSIIIADNHSSGK